MVEIKKFVEHKTAGWKGLIFLDDKYPGKEFIINKANVWESTPKRLEALREIPAEQVNIPELIEAWAFARERMWMSMSVTKELQTALGKAEG